MPVIYEPRGRAREYSPLALNLYNGCDHGCLYCYAPAVCKKTREEYRQVTPRPGIIAKVAREAEKMAGSRKQVLLCFMGDPYCAADVEYELTRQALLYLRMNGIPVAILTKGGTRCLRELDLFRDFGETIMVGATLTTFDKERAAEVEPGAALPEERAEVLRYLHVRGIKTWVSLEPVLDPADTLEIIRRTHDYVDLYKVGKVSAFPDHYGPVDWPGFLRDAVELLRATGRDFYVKADLRDTDPDCKLSERESTADFHVAKPWPVTATTSTP